MPAEESVLKIASQQAGSGFRRALTVLAFSAALTSILWADDELPDADFLEYLGSFGAEEADWVNLAPGADVEQKIDALLAANAPRQQADEQQEDETHE